MEKVKVRVDTREDPPEYIRRLHQVRENSLMLVLSLNIYMVVVYLYQAIRNLINTVEDSNKLLVLTIEPIFTFTSLAMFQAFVIVFCLLATRP